MGKEGNSIKRRSPDGAKRNPGLLSPHSASLHAGYGFCDLLDPLQRQRNPLPHPDTHGGERTLATALLERMLRRQGVARARHAERMAERDRAAVRIDVLGIVGEAELAQARERLRGKCLVELDPVEIADF